MTAPQSEDKDERAAYEKWLHDNFLAEIKFEWQTEDSFAWRAWKARAVLAAPLPELQARIYRKPAECEVACPPQQVCDYCQAVRSDVPRSATL